MKLRELRTANNWTQRQLAEKMNVSLPTVTQWECGYNVPRLSNIAKMQDIFGRTAIFVEDFIYVGD